MQQPKIQDDILQRLHRVACVYEMSAAKMLNHILAVALDELEGREDDYTICYPVRHAHAPKHCDEDNAAHDVPQH